MHKNHDAWMVEKKRLERFGRERLAFHERDVWWCSIGLNLGDEQDGKNEFFERPVLVLKKFNEKIAWVLPMTSQEKQGEFYHLISYGNRTSTVILSQMRLVSVKRFRRFVQRISPHQFTLVEDKFLDLFQKKRSPPGAPRLA